MGLIHDYGKNVCWILWVLPAKTINYFLKNNCWCRRIPTVRHSIVNVWTLESPKTWSLNYYSTVQVVSCQSFRFYRFKRSLEINEYARYIFLYVIDFDCINQLKRRPLAFWAPKKPEIVTHEKVGSMVNPLNCFLRVGWVRYHPNSFLVR